jgi:Ran GTPase-activating protein (RanGAP) involved in mRNA processing and transport
LGPREWKPLARSPNLARLVYLDLSGNGIGAAGARALPTSPHLANLRVLDLESNSIGPEGARALAESATLAGLAELRLNIGRASARLLKKRFGDRLRLL